MQLYSYLPPHQYLPRASAKELSPDRFSALYDHTCTPVVLTEAADWAAGGLGLRV